MPQLFAFALYALIGGVGTLAHYGVLILLVSGAGLGAAPATTLGALVGATLNFVLNARFNFGTDRPLAAALRFFLVAGAGIGVNALCMVALNRYLGLNYMLAQLVCTGVVLVFTYSLNASWTFRRRPAARRPPTSR